PICTCCGYPFEFDAGADSECANCIARPPKFKIARSAFQYDEHSRKMILAFKHGDQTDQAAAFGSWMHRAGIDLFEGAPILIPVPLHTHRLLKRRYNQASILADQIARLTGLEVDHLNFRRVKKTESQGFMSLKARHKNVKGAFNYQNRARSLLKGRPAILIDDVYTTGATLNECARCLIKSGASEVRALTLSRVVRASSLTDL
ncbi:MAG: ComF family protein, partial [Sneathiella sp.]|nr:ComF family protein [Sneathiella sp.]